MGNSCRINTHHGRCNKSNPCSWCFWCNLWRTWCLLGNFPKGKNSDLYDVRILLENDAYSGKVVLAILVSISELVTIFHWRVWCSRWRSCISCTHWRLCSGTCNRISLQKNTQLRVYLWHSIRIQTRLLTLTNKSMNHLV